MDAPATTVLTEADLLKLGAQGLRFEVIDGEVVEMSPVGVRHAMVAGNAYDVLKPHVTANKLGYIFMDGLIYVLHVDPVTGIRKARIPDTSFVRKGRLPKDFDLSRPFPGAPDLAIEVVSPEETADELLAKIRDYFAYGTEQVWVLYPNQIELHQHIQGEKGSHVYTEGDTIDGGSLLPGLTIAVKDLFTIPEEE
jgi:Uma2 family endonuclease